MPIDMRGYKVVHGNYAYKCLYVEPTWEYSDDWCLGEIRYPEELRVTFIDHNVKIAQIEDYADKFVFIKE